MASHPSYPHPGAGPSSYYQPSPPPHHVYGSHSPGPPPTYYTYAPPPPPPPHMSSHRPPYQQGSRGNSRGGYGSRGNHHYHNYGHQHHQHPYPAHINPSLGVHPQHNPYSPQPAKYNQPYSPSYSYPSPNAPVFVPSWQQQPISPLPKQLSMPPPPAVPSPYYESPRPQPATVAYPTLPSPAKTPVQSDEIAVEESPALLSEPVLEPTPAFEHISSQAPTLDTETATLENEVVETVEPEVEPTEEDVAEVEPSSFSPFVYSQMGTISTSESLASASTSEPDAQKTGQWAIWSRRPHDPSLAPGIIISPRARPPPNIIQQALNIKTPPVSVPSSPVVSTKPLVSARASQEELSSERSQATEEVSEVVWSSQTNSTAPSSSESEHTPTIPGSPASSSTSLSGTNKDVKEVASVTKEADADVQVSAVAEPEVTPEASVDATTSEPSESVAAALPETTEVAPTPDMPSVEVQSAIAAPDPLTPSQPPVKKSWASLLHPASSPSPTGPTRNALPTSSVIGFSIPATPPTPTTNAAPVPVSPSKKSDLVTLLTSGPTTGAGATGFAAAASGATSGTPLRIRSRGLVNSGNMCFANSVLQILLYCPPFNKLFNELGDLLIGPAVGNGKDKDNKDVKNAAGATPLVDATIEFLREFSEEKRKGKGKDKGKLEVVGTSGRVLNGVNGSGSSNGRGKGKEKEIQEVEEDDWDSDSFLPGYFYDAMKASKRFEHMRGGHQEDAEEFLGFYLDSLEEELLSVLRSVNPPPRPAKTGAPVVEEKEEEAPPEDDGWLEVGKRNRMVVTRTTKGTESPITRIFGGKFRSTLRAPGQKDSATVEDWRSLRLDIQRDQIHTVQDALAYISHPQNVQITSSGRPGVTVEAQQQVLIEALPPILVLHMKRFCYDTTVGGVVKVGKQVRFTPELEIGPDVMIPAIKKSSHPKYKLFGVLYHHGQSASGGHYTLDVLHPNRYPSATANAKPKEGWIRIDDELVSDVRPDDVFGAYERDDSRCAYLLFYRRI